MIITHVYHSGFVLELSETVLIFDWYSGELPSFDPTKKVIVLVTHGQPDHYSQRIWELADRCKRISYVLDSCTAPERETTSCMSSPGDTTGRSARRSSRSGPTMKASPMS